MVKHQDKTPDKIALGISNIMIWIYHFTLWILYNVIFDPLRALYRYFKHKCVDSYFQVNRDNWKSIAHYIGSIIAAWILCFLIIDSVNWRFEKRDKRYHKEQYAKIIEKDYQQEVRNFFLLYEDRRKANDCDYMSKLAVDLSMYSRFWRTKYEDYKCPAFSQFNNLKMLPVEINPPTRNGNYIKIAGSYIRVEMKNNQGRTLSPTNFEIWKDLAYWDDLWRFNVIWTSQDRAINTSLKY